MKESVYATLRSLYPATEYKNYSTSECCLDWQRPCEFGRPIHMADADTTTALGHHNVVEFRRWRWRDVRRHPLPFDPYHSHTFPRLFRWALFHNVFENPAQANIAM